MLAENRKVKQRLKKINYYEKKKKKSVMMARFEDLPILTVSRGMARNIISFCISSNHR